MMMLFLFMGIGAGIFYAITVARTPQNPPNIMNPSEVHASTDLYADSFFAALSCMKTKEAGGCNKDDKKSKMIQNVTNQIFVLNGASHPIPEKKDLIALVEVTELSKVNYMTLTTDDRGKDTLTLTYSNKEHTVVINFTKNVEGELLVKNMEIKPKG